MKGGPAPRCWPVRTATLQGEKLDTGAHSGTEASAEGQTKCTWIWPEVTNPRKPGRGWLSNAVNMKILRKDGATVRNRSWRFLRCK